MITFTNEQLIASAHARIEFAEMMLAGELEPLKERTWSIELELARIALASLEAEPVGVARLDMDWTAHRNVCMVDMRPGLVLSELNTGMNLYTAPPALAVMKDHQIRELVNELRDVAIQYHDKQQLRERIAHSVRAAMKDKADPVAQLEEES